MMHRLLLAWQVAWLFACSVSAPIGTFVVKELVKFEGYAGSADINIKAGTELAVVVAETGGVALKGELTGLDVNATGGMHIHAGTTCDNKYGSAGVHYFEGSETTVDPWVVKKWVSNENGEAIVDLTLSADAYGYDPEGISTIGKVVVVHDKSGSKAFCGRIELKDPSVDVALGQLKPYFSIDSATTPAKAILKKGDLSVATVTVNQTTLKFQLQPNQSLAANSEYKLLIADSNSCSAVDTVNRTNLNVTLSSDNVGAIPQTTIPLEFDLATGKLQGEQFLNRAFILANSTDDLICGVMIRAVSVEGHVMITKEGDMTHIIGWANNLPETPRAMVGAHVHIGASCSEANGGHLLVGNIDPYLDHTAEIRVSTMKATASLATYARTYFEFSHNVDGAGPADVQNRTYTLHDQNGDRIACAELRLVPKATATTAGPTTATTASPTTASPTTNNSVKALSGVFITTFVVLRNLVF